MPEIAHVIDQLREDNSIYDASNDPAIGFVNRNNEVLLGAQLLPDLQQDNNFYSSESVGFLDVIADDADRYSPPRFKGLAARVAAMEVALGDINIGQQLWAAEYDKLARLAATGGTIEQMARVLLDFVGTMSRGMSSKSELQRWGAIVRGQVERIVGETRSLINYPSATGQRATLANAWSDPTYDPMRDFEAAEDFGSNQGYNRISRIVSSTFGKRTLARNPNMKNYIFGDELVRRVSTADVDRYLADEGFPTIETYDTLWYDTNNRSGRYLPQDAIVFVYDTGQRNEPLATFVEGNNRVFVPQGAVNGATIGHNGIGTAGGEATPGRVVDLYQPQGRPKRVIGEGVQTSLPVFDAPHGFMVRTGIR